MTGRTQRVIRAAFPIAAVVAAVVLIGIPGARAQENPDAKATVDLYGFAMLDMGYDSGQNDPLWFDVMRPTKLPYYEDQFGKDGNFYSGVRQSRFGVKAFIPTAAGEVKTIFEFELFGVGADAGQTTFRLRHAWGELGQFGAGQTWSPFMDPDVFPNSVEYWGPPGMVFFRNVQLRWTPMSGDDEFMVALERPGASGDEGEYDEFIEPGRIDGRFPLPDLSAHYRMTRPWGHLQIAGILREIKWDDMAPGEFDLSGSATAWGLNVSTNLKFGDDVLRASVIYGEGVENYMNDATVDAGLTDDPLDPVELLPVTGVVAFLDHKWNDKWTTTVGYSMIDLDNSDAQTPDAFAKGQYALLNFMYYPAPNVMLGPELQWGSRENNFDGGFDSSGNLVESFDDFRIQFSAKYSFKHTMGGAK